MPIYVPTDETTKVIHEKRADLSPCGGEGSETNVADSSLPPKRWFICRKCGEQFWRRREG